MDIWLSFSQKIRNTWPSDAHVSLVISISGGLCFSSVQIYLNLVEFSLNVSKRTVSICLYHSILQHCENLFASYWFFILEFLSLMSSYVLDSLCLTLWGLYSNLSISACQGVKELKENAYESALNITQALKKHKELLSCIFIALDKEENTLGSKTLIWTIKWYGYNWLNR